MVFRMRKIVSFELSKRNRERCFSFCHERGIKKKISIPLEETNLRPSDSALRYSFSWGFSVFFVPRSLQDEKHLSLVWYCCEAKNFP